MPQEIPTSNEPSPEVLEWASTLNIVLSFIDVAVATLDLKTGKDAMSYFFDRASRAAAVLPILQISPANVQQFDTEARTFKAFFELCSARAEQRMATSEASVQKDTIDQLRASFGL